MGSVSAPAHSSVMGSVSASTSSSVSTRVTSNGHGLVSDGTFSYLSSETKKKSFNCKKGNFDAHMNIEYRINKFRKSTYHSNYNILYNIDNMKIKEYVIHRNNGQKGGK